MVQVGSRIVLYNAAVNCYILPTTFTYDNVNNIYWVPVFSDSKDHGFNPLEAYNGVENGNDSCNYCSDTGATVYVPATNWMQTINLDSMTDAAQVRCPGCTQAHPLMPEFYQGLGYSTVTKSRGRVIEIGTAKGPDEIGAPIEYPKNINKMKFTYIGSNEADFTKLADWTVAAPDAAGSPPASLGYVDSALFSRVYTHSLRLPCCSYTDKGARHANTSDTTTSPSLLGIDGQGSLRVFPNPATMTVNFQFGTSDNVTIRITDVTGRLMEQQIITNAILATFDVHSYNRGIYIYQVTMAGKVQTGKIVIE